MRVEYLHASRSACQELVLLHGWGASVEVWRPLLVHVRPWANVTLVELPGCSPQASESQAFDWQGLGDAVLSVAPRRAVYVGWSMGGQLAVQLASRTVDRVTGLITVCSNPCFVAQPDWPGMEREEFSQFHQGLARKPLATLTRFLSLVVSGAASSRQLLRQYSSMVSAASARRVQTAPAVQEKKTELLSDYTLLLQGLKSLERLDLRRDLHNVNVPQLHLLGLDDALVPAAVADALQDHLRDVADAQVLREPGSHALLLESPERLAKVIKRFLQEHSLLRESAESATLSKDDVAQSFSRAAHQYDSVAMLQRSVGEAVLGRLPASAGRAERVLDLGCGTGYFAPALQRRYPQSHYVGLDIAVGMIQFARQQNDCQALCSVHSEAGAQALAVSERVKDWLVADAEALPLASESVDLVFSSLAVQWCEQPALLFAELARVLRRGGRCVFSTLGPATLCELRASWAEVDSYQHVNNFLDADALHAAVEHVPGVSLSLEVEQLQMQYVQASELLRELKTLGAHNMNRGRAAGLTHRRALQDMFRAYERWRVDGKLPATYEVFYGVLEKA